MSQVIKELELAQQETQQVQASSNYVIVGTRAGWKAAGVLYSLKLFILS